MYKNVNLLRRDERYIEANSRIPGVTITPNIINHGNIYKGEEYPKEISFAAESEKEVELICSLVNTKLESEALKELKLCGKEEITISLPDFRDVYGVFRICVEAFEEGEKIGEENIGFSHIRAGERCGLKKSGTCVHYIYHDNDMTKNAVKLIADCGLSSMRDDFIWRFCEIEKDKVFIPENYDNMINFFIDEGIDVNLLFLYTNPHHDNDKTPYTEEGIAAYARYCAFVADYYKDKVNKYEIWNEYNLEGGFNPGSEPPETYAKMLKAAYTEIKKVNPNAVITAGVTCSPHYYWLDRMLAAGGYDYCDEVSLHPYCSVPDSTYPDQGQVEANTQAYIDIVKKYGEEKPVWVSEIGWTTDVAEGGSTREEQAACLARLFALTESGDTISKLTMYDFEDDYGNNPYFMEAHWGLVENPRETVPHAAKESFAAVSQLNYMIGGRALKGRKITDKIQAIAFDDLLILWSLDGERIAAVKAESEVTYFDMYGNESKLSAENGEFTLKVDRNPCYLKGGNAELIKAEIIPYENLQDKYTLTLVPELREDGWYLKAQVNAWKNCLGGRVRIEIPELEVYGQYSDFSLNKGESYAAEFKMPETDVYKRYDVITDLVFANGVREVKNEKISFLSVARRGEEKTSFTLNVDKDYKKILKETEKPTVLNADIALSYDEEYFYLDAEVLDESHLQIGTAHIFWKDIWDGDNIEFMLQPIYDGNKDITRFSDIGLALTSSTGQSVAWRWRTLKDRSYGIFRSCDFKAERNGNITSYKARIPWAELLPPAISLEDCLAFGFALRVGYANSTPHSLDGYMQIYGGIGSWRAPLSYMPQEFGTIVLQK